MRNVLYEIENNNGYLRIEGLDINNCRAYVRTKRNKYFDTEEEIIFSSREALEEFMKSKGDWTNDRLHTTFLLRLVLNDGIMFCSTSYPNYDGVFVAVVGGVLESIPPQYTIVEWGAGYSRRYFTSDVNSALAEYGIGKDWVKHRVKHPEQKRETLEELMLKLSTYPLPVFSDNE